MSGNENSTSKDNPFMKKGTPTTSDSNPFKTKMLNEDSSDGLKRAFFESKRELAERKSENQNDND